MPGGVVLRLGIAGKGLPISEDCLLGDELTGVFSMLFTGILSNLKVEGGVKYNDS